MTQPAFVKLTSPNGDPFIVPTRDVLGAEATDQGSVLHVAQRAPQTLGGIRKQPVRESLDELLALLNGEPVAPPVKAHPDAQPWGFLDIQKAGAS